MHEDWRNFTSYVASCHPLTLLITHPETGDSNIPAYAFALRLMATVSCPSIKRILLYRFGYMFFSRFILPYLFCALVFQTRLALGFPFLRRSQALQTEPFMFPLTGDDHFFVKQLIFFIVALFSLNYLENIQLTPTDGMPVYYSVRDRGIGYIGTHSTIFLF